MTSTSESAVQCATGKNALAQFNVRMKAALAAQKKADDEWALSMVAEDDNADFGWVSQVKVLQGDNNVAVCGLTQRKKTSYEYNTCSRHGKSGCKCEGRDNGYLEQEDDYDC